MEYIIKNKFNEEIFIDFLRKQGLVVKTDTKARGNLGTFTRNRIDISIRVPEDRRISVLAHEFAHKIHYDLENDFFATGGTLEKLFKTDYTNTILHELFEVTSVVDPNSLFEKINSKKQEVKKQIKHYELPIKAKYPHFQRSKAFKEATKILKNSKAKYLLKHDRIVLVSPILRHKEYFSVDTIRDDFPELPDEIIFYIKIKCLQRRQKSLSARMNKAKKYYHKPSELFARFIEGLFVDKAQIISIAPYTYQKFNTLLNTGYYGELRELISLANL